MIVKQQSLAHYLPYKSTKTAFHAVIAVVSKIFRISAFLEFRT